MSTLIQILLVLTLFFISWVDIKTKRIPIEAVLVLLSFGVLWMIETKSPFLIQTSVSVLSGLLFWGLGFCVSQIKKEPALGFGDVQLWIVLALFLAPNKLPLFIMTAGGIGCLMKFFFSKEKIFPFAPALSLGFLATFYGV